MANKRISSLDDITLVGGTSTAEVNANDILPITDVDDTTGSPQGTTKAVKVSDLMGESPVQSVNTQTGAVVLDADDIDDTSTSHKFVTASDITNLGNLSGTNTGDQDLSSYQLQPSEGAFVDGDKTKLDGIEASADVTDTANVTAAGALMDSEVTNLAQVKAFDSADYATAAQGSLADTATQPSDLGTAATQDVGTANGNVVQLDATGLPAVDGSQLTNVSGTDSSKLAIASNLSDLNDAATARANLGLGTAATTASTEYATAAQGTTADSAVQPTDSIDVLADVDTSTVAPTTDDLLKWNGSNFVPGTVSVDVDTPLNTALRGTDNPHIGAFPNQSFKVTDNPYKSVMVIADADGNLDFLVKTDDANIFLNTPSARKAASFGFSVVEDSTEPDIEVAGTLVGSVENYSVISGDSDTKGVNGLPIRQGFNNPDIGANPAPILISGGSIA
jgi:hypothetical protein